MIHYPKELNPIFNTLLQQNIRPIIVGGFIRDTILGKKSKDIDIELYNLSSFEELENILKKFGTINSVGKNFGVCKLSFNDLDLDFSFPRKDNKIASGHKGFDVTIDSKLDFKIATSRRDFTINAIGYDIEKKKLLDPFNGLDDLKNKILKAVDLKTFQQDPLRVLRASQFYARFDLNIDYNLFTLCEQIVSKNLLDELPKERIFTEIEKLLLKSTKPSKGFKLLRDIKSLRYLKPINLLKDTDFDKILDSIDKIAIENIKSKNIKLILMLAILCSKFNSSQTILFITNLTNNKKILKEVLILNKSSFQYPYNISQLYKLATKVNIELFLIYQKVIHINYNDKIFCELREKAIELNILNKKIEPLLQGKDIIKLGIKPSKEFSKILNLAYNEQLNLKIKTKKEAQEWLKKYFNLIS